MLRLIIAIAWFLMLIWAMWSPGTSFPEVDLFDFQDKVIHWIVFVVQSYLWTGIGESSSKALRSSRRVWLNFAIFGLGTGILLEFGQQFIPFRTFDYIDMIVNVIGAITGLLVYFKWPSIKIILE